MFETIDINNGKQFRTEFLISLLLGLIVLACFFPGVLFFQEYPMKGSGFLYTDPAAGSLNFIPGIRLFQYELFTQHNLLWSNLRGFGIPYLAHEIQAAPLFPLTLLFAWIPEPWFWSMTFIARLVLALSGAYLLAVCIFQFSRLSSLVFAVILIYNLFVLHWMNHPWVNGYLSGIWYLLFLSLAGKFATANSTKTPGWILVGLIISVYCMVTNGFPEASVLATIITLLVLPCIYLQQNKHSTIQISVLIKGILISHLIGFALSSPQLLSFLVYIFQRPEGDDLRTSFGMRQYKMEELWHFVRYNFTFTGEHISTFGKSAVGFTVFTLSMIGFLDRISDSSKRNWLDLGILLTAIFYIIKNFPIWPGFNEFIGSLPLIREMYFHVYFFVMVQLFFAFYGSIGIQTLFQTSINNKLKLLTLFSILFACWLLYEYFDYRYLKLNRALIVEKINHFALYGIFLICLILTICSKRMSRYVTVVLISCLILVELRFVYNGEFPDVTDKSLNSISHHETSAHLAQLLEENGISRLDNRTNDRLGTHFYDGVASGEHGAPPFILERPKFLRTALYKTPMGGVRELGREIRPYSANFTAVNIQVSDIYNGTSLPPPDLNGYQLIDTAAGHFDGTANQSHAGKDDFILSTKGQSILLKGWGLIKNRDSHELDYYLHLIGENDQHFIPLKYEYRRDVAQTFGNRQYRYSGWEINVRRNIFAESAYQLRLKIIDPQNKTYTDLSLANLKIQHRQPTDNTWRPLGGFDKQYYDFRNNSLTRAYKASGCVPVEDMYEATGFMKTGEHYQHGIVYLETNTPKQRNFCETVDEETESVKIIQDNGSLVSLDLVSGPAIVVLSDSYYDGWTVVDETTGNEMQILPANTAFRAVILDEDREYKLTFKYYPGWLNWSLFLVISGLLWLCYLLYFKRKCSNSRQAQAAVT